MIDIERVVKYPCKTCDGTGRAKAYSGMGEEYMAKCWATDCRDGQRFETDLERAQRQRAEWKTEARRLREVIREAVNKLTNLHCKTKRDQSRLCMAFDALHVEANRE